MNDEKLKKDYEGKFFNFGTDSFSYFDLERYVYQTILEIKDEELSIPEGFKQILNILNFIYVDGQNPFPQFFKPKND